jgi:hypothetical protein
MTSVNQASPPKPEPDAPAPAADPFVTLDILREMRDDLAPIAKDAAVDLPSFRELSVYPDAYAHWVTQLLEPHASAAVAIIERATERLENGGAATEQSRGEPDHAR